MPLLKSVSLPLICVLVLACGAASAASRDSASSDKDLKRAETIVEKLRHLEAASAEGYGALRKAGEKIYPGLFALVADLRDGDIKTDISTAAALYDTARRGVETNGKDAPDCSRELRASYFQLCRESASRARLLRAKARMHTGFAEAAILYARGDRSEATLDALAQVRAERAVDVALAEEALRALKELAVEAASDSTKQLSERVNTSTLVEVESLLASLPRCRVRQLLRNAHDAFRDGLFWQIKATPARALVVSVNSLDAPDPLRQLNLSADAAERAAIHNRRGALKFISKAEAALSETRP